MPLLQSLRADTTILAGRWQRRRSMARPMLLAGMGALALALTAAAVTLAGLVGATRIETKLQARSENELHSLHALVVSVMERRLTDASDVATGVLNEVIARRNLEYPGQIWTVWSPQVTRYVAKTTPQRTVKAPRDAVDEAALRGGVPVGRFVNGDWRFSLPIVLGVTAGAEQAACHVCHQGRMGLHDGDVIAVFSSRLSAAQEFAALREQLWEVAGAGLLGTGIVVMLVGAFVAQRARGRQELGTQLSRFDAALGNMLQGLLMTSHDGRVLVVNRRYCEITGLPADAVTPGMTYTDLTRCLVTRGRIRTEDVEWIRTTRAALIDRGERSTFVWTLMDSRSLNVTHQPMAEGWLTTYEDITERRAAEARIEHLAKHDALTGLANRVLFREKLEQATLQTRRGGLLALHLLDLDRFKIVNDTLGHPIGDRLLQAVTERLLKGVRETDTVARLGGDEFAILQIPMELPNDAIGFASRLIELIDAPFEIEGHRILVGSSIGITFGPQDGQDAEQLMKCADLALYRAKADGRGVFRLFHAEMDAAMQARCALEANLGQALSAGQFELFYQPLIDLRAGRISGYEALLRWRHPARGLLLPGQFIAVAEETGLIGPIGEWVLAQACVAAATWPEEMNVTVNLSAAQFRSDNLIAIVSRSLSEAGLSPQRLELDINEAVMLQDTDATLATLHRLREMGVAIAMADFGPGHSSLSYLRRFAFDRLKINPSFVRNLNERANDIAIVRAVTALGRELGIAVIAEGVETREQLATLERAGCTEMQGFLFSAAVPADMVNHAAPEMFAKQDVLPHHAA